jgi:hypothetical protein
MKTISYRGQLPVGTQAKIDLKTNKGKVGYRITKFQIISETPGTNNIELIGQIFKKTQEGLIGPVVNFDNQDLMAVAFHVTQYGPQTDIIFDNSVTNQNIFITMTDQSGNTVPGNYYIELETMDLSDVESTMLTLKSLRDIASKGL